MHLVMNSYFYPNKDLKLGTSNTPQEISQIKNIAI